MEGRHYFPIRRQDLHLDLGEDDAGDISRLNLERRSFVGGDGKLKRAVRVGLVQL